MKISVITTSFNSANTLSDTLRSILKQNYSNYENIVIDGASTDGTLEIIRDFEGKFNGRLKYISEPDKGIYDAMNKGIKMATGDVVGFLNSDDFFSSENTLNQIAKTIEPQEINCVFGNLKIVDNKNLSQVIRYYKAKNFKPFWLNFGIMPPHPTLYVKKHVFDKIGIFEPSFKIVADFDFLLRLFKNTKLKYKHINSYLVIMRSGGASNDGISSKIKITKEIKRACSINNVYTNIIFLYLRFPFKLLQSFIS